MSWFPHRYETGRSTRLELMDQPDARIGELEQAYAELERLNRWLGGHGASRYGIESVIRRAPELRELRVLDVGSGGGELAPLVVGWGQRVGRSISVVGIDDDRAAIEYAQTRYAGPRVRFQQAGLFEFEPEAPFDVVHMGLTLHHFDDAEVVRALRRMAELATLGVVVNDLQRHPVPFYAVQVVTSALRSPDYVRHDAPLSVNRAFTKSELLALASEAGWTWVRVDWRPMFRWVLTGGTAARERATQG